MASSQKHLSLAAAQQQLPTPKISQVPGTSVTAVREGGMDKTGLRERSPEIPAEVRPVETAQYEPGACQPSVQEAEEEDREYEPARPSLQKEEEEEKEGRKGKEER